MQMSPPLSDLAGYSPFPAAAAMGEEVDEAAAPVDHFDRLPDSVLLLVFNRIGDVKALGRCCVVSRRFHSLVPLVDDVLVRVDCVIPDEVDHPHAPTTSSPTAVSSSSRPPPSASSSCPLDKPPRRLLSHLTRLLLGSIIRPLQAIGQILASTPSTSPGAAASSSVYRNSHDDASSPSSPASSSEVSHHSPTEVLRNFKEIRRLRIELPGGELSVEDGVLLKWKAHFGSTLDSCVILGASSVLSPVEAAEAAASSCGSASDKGGVGEAGGEGFCRIDGSAGGGVGDDSGSIPESFYTNGSLKLRVVWTISSLIAASARHYLLQPIVAEHGTLERLDLTDADGQGVLQMGRGQLEELRVRPVSSASGVAQRTLVPALNMRLWYAHEVEVAGGVVLKGATLVAIRPSERPLEAAAAADTASWVCSAFEEPYGSAVRQLVKRRMYCLEMNSF